MQKRISSFGRQKAWTRAEVLEGVKYFMELYGRFPMAREMDSFEGLPSARSIQRTFGGLLQLKSELGVKDTYHAGEKRSNIGRLINKRALENENTIGTWLDEVFGEICVHRQASAGEGNKERLDFVVYYRGGKFGIDLFYPEDLFSLQGCILIKMKKYKTFHNTIFFVQMNDDIDQVLIEKMLVAKKVPLDSNIIVISQDEFKKRARHLTKLEIT